MLEKIRMERFKSIRSNEIEFGRVNLFIGANGSGKSNILEAIGLASAMLGRGISSSDLLRKGIRLTPAELMKSAHKNRELPKTLELEIRLNPGIVYKCNLSASIKDPNLGIHSESCIYGNYKQFGRSARGNKVGYTSIEGYLDKQRGIWDQVQAAFKFDEPFRSGVAEFSRFAIYSPQTDFLRGRKTAAVDDPPIGLHGEGLPDAVFALLRQRFGARQDASNEKKSESTVTRSALDLIYLPGWTRGVRVGPLLSGLVSPELSSDNEKMVYFVDKYMREERNKLSAYDSSEGTLFLLFAAVLLAHRSAPKIFALDNVDSALNPRVTRLLVEKIVEITKYSSDGRLDVGPRQVFLTSHNPTSLDAIDIFDNDQRAFVVSRDQDSGDTIVRRLEPASGSSRTDWALATGGKRLSQLWLDGVIAGVNGDDDF